MKASARSSRSGRRSCRGSETPPGGGGPRGRTPRSGEVQVRAARAEDVGSVAALWVALLAYHRDLGEEDIHPSRASAEGRRFIKEHVGTGDRICLVAESGDGAIGFLVGTLGSSADNQGRELGGKGYRPRPLFDGIAWETATTPADVERK